MKLVPNKNCYAMQAIAFGIQMLDEVISLQ